MGIVNYQNLNAANTAYEAAFVDVFAGGPKGHWSKFSRKISSKTKFLELDILASFPRVREWVGPKVIKELRAYKKTIELTSWEVTTRIKRRDVEYDPTGVVGQALAGFVRSQEFMYDDVVFSKLVANTWTGYDGVTLLNDSHPNVHSSGTSDNLTTSALSYSTFNAGIAAMRRVTDEDGKPLGINPTDLYVGPAQERVALDVVGALRPIAVSNAGAYDGTSSVVGAVAIGNSYAGRMNVNVVDWLSGNQWLMIDQSKPAMPVVCMEARGPVAIPVTEMNAHERFFNDEFYYSIESDAQFDCGMWQLIYGSVTT